MRIVIPEFIDEGALGAFGDGFDVHYAPELVDDREALLGAVADAAALIVRNRTEVDRALLEAAPRLQVVGRLGVGLDNIDVAACEARGIAVRPATGANALSVAEYVITTALMLLRGAYRADDAVMAGDWPRTQLIGREAAGCCLGLWGFGQIARVVAAKARALGMEVAAFDPYVASDNVAWAGIERCYDPEALVARADVLSLHLPLTDETRGLINAGMLARMKPGAVLINTARGGIVDEAALCKALSTGALGGAALDVFAEEPLTATAAERFRGVPNLVLTPHIAGVTAEANARVSLLTVQNVLEELAHV